MRPENLFSRKDTVHLRNIVKRFIGKFNSIFYWKFIILNLIYVLETSAIEMIKATFTQATYLTLQMLRITYDNERKKGKAEKSVKT